MYRSRRRILMGTLAISALVAVFASLWVWATRNPAELTLQELGEAAGQSYIYGYPLVLMDETRRDVTERAGVPANRLAHVRTLPGPGFNSVVRPNLDTLYSLAWLDLGSEALLLEVPAMEDRYWLFQGLDAWTNVFADAGVRTLGTGPVSILIAGPDFEGSVPEGMILYRSPTRMAWFLGRIEIDGADDLQAVHRLQDALRLYPYRSMPGGHGVVLDRPEADAADDAPPKRVDNMDSQEFFNRLGALMVANPPADGDRQALDRLSVISGGPGVEADWSGYGILARYALERGVSTARQRLADGPDIVAGWTLPQENIGRFGDDHAYRAGVALYGLGANLPEDAAYPAARTDTSGEILNGSNAYRIRFAPDALPPVNAFWSVTLYDTDGYLIANEAGRHALTSRDDLVHDDDGGLTLDIHSGPPDAGREANWLPAPQGSEFTLLARLYWPQEAALDGSWSMPAVERLED